MSVNYTANFNDYSAARYSEACFGALRYLNDVRNWEDIPQSEELTSVEYHINSEDVNGLEGSPVWGYLNGESVEVSADVEADALITIFSIFRCGLPLRDILYGELMQAGHWLQGRTPSVDGEEAVFDLRRLSMADALSALIMWEDRGVMYKGYQPPMRIDGYVRCNSDCDVGESVTGYWQAPATTGRYNELGVLSFYEAFGRSVSDYQDKGKFNEFLDACKMAAMDTLKSGELQPAIDKFMADGELPEDVREQNICLLYQNLQREVL